MGEKRTVIKTKAEVYGIEYYTLQICYFDLGEYMVTLTLASYVEDKTQELLGLFEKYE